jgi:hypothetical protein
MSTANDIITMALKICAVKQPGETPSSEEANDCLTSLNFMLDKWNNEKLMLYYNLNSTKALTASDYEYTIGSGGDWNIARPIKIESAFIRDTSSIDTPVEIISNNEYQGIADKTSTGRPEKLFYNPLYPLGYIYLYPAPSTTYTLGISQLSALAQMTLAATIALPNGYLYALATNLALEIAPMFGKTVSEIMFKNAADAKHNLKATNEMPSKLDTSVDILGGSSFDINRGW